MKKSSNKDYQFWKQHNHPIELDSYEIIQQRLNNFHQNPVETGFVSKPEDWVYSSARDYAGEKEPIEIVILDE